MTRNARHRAARVASTPAEIPHRRRHVTVAVIVGGLFLLRITPWATSDLWFDEVLTLDDYGVRPSLTRVITEYPAANHHVLFSSILWAWLRVIEPRLWEWLMRAPSIVMGVTLVMLPVLHWRKWLGERASIACAATLAASLVVGGFAWQLRGYPMAMLLGALATGGAMELVAGSRRIGLAVTLPAIAALPLVMPSNVLLVGSLGAFLVLAKPRDLSCSAWATRTLIPVAMAAALGCAYYLTIVWTDFRRVWVRSEGWPGAWPVVSALAVAAVAHFGPILLLFAWQHRRGLYGERIPGDRRDLALAWKLLAPLLVLSALLLAIQRPAPFPRTFLVCLPSATLAVFIACRSSAIWTRFSPVVLAGMMAGYGVAWQSATDRLTTAALREGRHPQNLVMEYYRGRNDISMLTRALREAGVAQHVMLLVDFHDFTATRYYWKMSDLPTSRLVVAWDDNHRTSHGRAHLSTIGVQAYSSAHAVQLLRDAGLLASTDPPPPLHEAIRAKGLSLWMTTPL